MAKKLSKLPGVLSFQRCLLVTDAIFVQQTIKNDQSVLNRPQHSLN